jgi:predicted ester cyclase
MYEVFNTGNTSTAPKLIAQDYRFGDREGPDGWKDAVNSWHVAFPDVRFAVDQVVGEGDWLAYRLTVEGTFKGKWMGVEPTGKKVKGTLAFFSQFKDGKLFTAIAFADTLSWYQQMGAAPPGYEMAKK